MSSEPCLEDTEPDEDDNIGLDLIDHLRLIESVVIKATERLSSPLLHKELGRVGSLQVQQEARALATHLRDLTNAADQLLLDAMEGERQVEIDGRIVTQRRAYVRKWDTPLLAGAVAATVLQGERLPEVDQVVEAFVKAARLEWRVTALEDLGVDHDKYAEKELGPPKVSVS